MKNIFKNPKNQKVLQRVVLVLLCFVVFWTLWQIADDLRLLRHQGVMRRYRGAQTMPVAQIQSWMTLRYINIVFRLPEAYLKIQLNISSTRYPNLSVDALAKAQKKSSTQELALVRQAVANFISQSPGAPRP